MPPIIEEYAAINHRLRELTKESATPMEPTIWSSSGNATIVSETTYVWSPTSDSDVSVWQIEMGGTVNFEPTTVVIFDNDVPD